MGSNKQYGKDVKKEKEQQEKKIKVVGKMTNIEKMERQKRIFS